MSSSPFIETFTGVRFQPLKPNFADIRIEDIAHALSNQCRFSGHVRHFYGVAEHSVRVSRLLTGLGAGVELWGLLHDASEAYLVDLPTPLKSQSTIGDGYRVAERRLMRAVAKRFGLIGHEPGAVRVADAKLLATEVRDLMFAKPEHWSDGKLPYPPLGPRIVPWSPKTAEDEFLRRYAELEPVKQPKTKKTA